MDRPDDIRRGATKPWLFVALIVVVGILLAVVAAAVLARAETSPYENCRRNQPTLAPGEVMVDDPCFGLPSS